MASWDRVRELDLNATSVSLRLMETQLTLHRLWIFQSPTFVCWCCMHSFRPSSALSSGYHDIRSSWIYCDKCHLLILIPHERIIGVTPQQEYLILSFPPDILSSLVHATFISGCMCVFNTTFGCFLKVLTSGQRFLWMERLQKAKVMLSLINATMTSDVFGWLLERKKKKQQCCRRGKVSAAVHV